MHSIEIKISISKETLTLQDSESIIKSFRISAQSMVSFQEGSFQTPLGLNEIKSMIGDEVPIGADLSVDSTTAKYFQFTLMLSKGSRGCNSN